MAHRASIMTPHDAAKINSILLLILFLLF